MTVDAKAIFLILIILPFLASLLAPLLGRVWPKILGVFTTLIAASVLFCVYHFWQMVDANQPLVLWWPWVESLGISLSFVLDGLSLFWGFIISGMGVLVSFYATFYLGNDVSHRGRFYSYFLLFMGAMLGTVFANNLLLLFIFWELTGIASFFLIGFFFHKEESQLGARMALITTGTTGLVMLIGLVLVFFETQTFELTQIFQTDFEVAFRGGLKEVAVICFLIAAFGKSAQFPFHYWLPRAMAAPAPVSAYLHSAAMVKLGIFLCTRLYPLFYESYSFHSALIIVGFLTMMVGAYFAVLSHDLKGILAYSTVSQLGFLMGMIGLGNAFGVEHSYFHIVNHVFYKGALFMVVGIVDHTVHTRDIRKLGSLKSVMPLTAFAAFFAAMTMAGIPGTTGFLSKELLLTKIYEMAFLHGGLYWFPLIALCFSALCLIVFSIRIFYQTFIRRSVFVEQQDLHKPSFGIQISPLILSLLALIFGLFPKPLESFLSTFYANGLTPKNAPHIHLWHGFTKELFTSLTLIVCGILLYRWASHKKFRLAKIPRFLQFDRLFNVGYEGYTKFCGRLQVFLKAESPRDYITVTLFCLSLFLMFFAWPLFKVLDFQNLSFSDNVEIWAVAVLLLIVLGVSGCLFLKRWMAKILSLSLVGFLVTFYFVLYRAPDLALTQILVETASLLILMFLFYRFRLQDEEKELQNVSSKSRKTFSLMISIFISVAVFVILFAITQASPDVHLKDYFLLQSKALAGGTNVVNVILVDFRGYDTMGEITVLVLALLGGLGLLWQKKPKKPEIKS